MDQKDPGTEQKVELQLSLVEHQFQGYQQNLITEDPAGKNYPAVGLKEKVQGTLGGLNVFSQPGFQFSLEEGVKTILGPRDTGMASQTKGFARDGKEGIFCLSERCQ